MPHNIKEYADLESLVFKNKMLENKQRFVKCPVQFKAHEVEKVKNLNKMQEITTELLNRSKGEPCKEPVTIY